MCSSWIPVISLFLGFSVMHVIRKRNPFSYPLSHALCPRNGFVLTLCRWAPRITKCPPGCSRAPHRTSSSHSLPHLSGSPKGCFPLYKYIFFKMYLPNKQPETTNRGEDHTRNIFSFSESYQKGKNSARATLANLWETEASHFCLVAVEEKCSLCLLQHPLEQYPERRENILQEAKLLSFELHNTMLVSKRLPGKESFNIHPFHMLEQLKTVHISHQSLHLHAALKAYVR